MGDEVGDCDIVIHLWGPFACLELFIVVHVPACTHWLLAHANVKDSHMVIYDSIKLNHDKYQWHRHSLVRIVQLSHFVWYLIVTIAALTYESTSFVKPLQLMHIPCILYVMSQSTGKIPRFKIMVNNDVHRQGPKNECGVFFLKSIEKTSLDPPQTKMVKQKVELQ